MSDTVTIPGLIYCDVCGALATIGFTADEMAMASDYAEPCNLCDEHGSVGEEGGQELDQAPGARLIALGGMQVPS